MVSAGDVVVVESQLSSKPALRPREMADSELANAMPDLASLCFADGWGWIESVGHSLSPMFLSFAYRPSFLFDARRDGRDDRSEDSSELVGKRRS